MPGGLIRHQPAGELGARPAKERLNEPDREGARAADGAPGAEGPPPASAQASSATRAMQ